MTPTPHWRKSTHSADGESQCIEVAIWPQSQPANA
jgi:hypothetical protein